jgi:hypothetical protein
MADGCRRTKEKGIDPVESFSMSKLFMKALVQETSMPMESSGTSTTVISEIAFALSMLHFRDKSDR